ncbi:hypothetical protein L596_010948 [Steinernema carpocapsae]|uniref:Uncharacterized protein n=1 Tax=Steinernema carpocapsae TaxID=34508 RepID=A0A4U5PK28_STECR|nr:hypothetical protein L596_010948 [Steinernema carpocapsae]
MPGVSGKAQRKVSSSEEGHRCFFCRASGHHSALCSREKDGGPWRGPQYPARDRQRESRDSRQTRSDNGRQTERAKSTGRGSKRHIVTRPGGSSPRKTVETEAILVLLS